MSDHVLQVYPENMNIKEAVMFQKHSKVFYIEKYLLLLCGNKAFVISQPSCPVGYPKHLKNVSCLR